MRARLIPSDDLDREEGTTPPQSQIESASRMSTIKSSVANDKSIHNSTNIGNRGSVANLTDVDREKGEEQCGTGGGCGDLLTETTPHPRLDNPG